MNSGRASVRKRRVAKRTRSARDTGTAAAAPRRERRLWSCPRCHRTFRQVSQAHSCGVGSRAELLAGKPAVLVALYVAMEKILRELEGVEIVQRGRYALFRTTRIFADLVFMKDALRLMVLLPREVRAPLFFKIGKMSGRRIAHVAKVRRAADLRAVSPYLEEAWRFARSERIENP